MPPTIFPKVTTIIFPIIPDIGTDESSKYPIGIKYQLAILCSKPEVTNAIIGKKQDNIFPVVLSAEIASHTAKQTNQLQRIPLQKAIIHSEGKSIPMFAFALDIDTPTFPKGVKFPELP